MKFHKFRINIIVLLALFLFSIFGSATAESQFEVETIIIKVYRDGLTHITQTLIVDDLLPEVNLPLLSSSVENLIALDENQLAVDYQQTQQT